MSHTLVNVKGSARVYSWPDLLTFARIGRSPRPRWNISGIEVHGDDKKRANGKFTCRALFLYILTIIGNEIDSGQNKIIL